MRTPYALALSLLVGACVPEATPPTTPLDVPPSLQEPEPTSGVVGLSVSPATVRLGVGETVEVMAIGQGADEGVRMNLTQEATWVSSDPAVVVVEAPGRLRGLAPGSARVRAVYGALETMTTVEVTSDTPPPPGPATPVSLRVAPSPIALEPGGTVTLAATLSLSDGTSQDVTEAATWTVSDPSVATVAAGVLTARTAGSAEVQVAHAGLEAKATVTVTGGPTPCTYPANASSPIRVGSTMPPLRWPTAVGPDGSVAPLDLEAVHCEDAATRPSILVFVIGAGWCTACPSYIRNVNQQAAAIEAAGGRIVWVEAQDRSYRLASSSYADQYITDLVGRSHGVRIGDADTEPTRGAIYDAPLLEVFPSAFVVRTSDMQIIVDQRSSRSFLPYARIAQNPNGDWSNPNAPPFQSNCGPNDEETYEPNDTAAQAQVIAPGAFSGGICAAAPDYYRVDIAGSWRLDLTFRHATGDLDVYVWDEAQGRALEIGGNKVGSESYTDDESFTHAGPALIRVHGYEGASAPYQLSLTAL